MQRLGASSGTVVLRSWFARCSSDFQGPIEREYGGLSRALDVGVIAVPAMPVFIPEVIGVLDTSLSGSAAPLDICMVVLALVV